MISFLNAKERTKIFSNSENFNLLGVKTHLLTRADTKATNTNKANISK